MKSSTYVGGPYLYSLNNHRFTGIAYDGSLIDTSTVCSGHFDSCRNNPDCQCKNDGPIPEGNYTIGDMITYKGSLYSYQLFPSTSNSMCNRADFLIHGGTCAVGNPTLGNIIIESEKLRYKLKSGAILTVVA